MQQGSQFGFAVKVGTYRFEAGKRHSVTLSTANADGNVIADGVAFVKEKCNCEKIRQLAEAALEAIERESLVEPVPSDPVGVVSRLRPPGLRPRTSAAMDRRVHCRRRVAVARWWRASRGDQ